jgi:hypothetical protein
MTTPSVRNPPGSRDRGGGSDRQPDAGPDRRGRSPVTVGESMRALESVFGTWFERSVMSDVT